MHHPLRRVGVHWPRLGPYHLARLRAAHAWFAERGVELVALETARVDQTYAWQTQTTAERFERVRLFEREVYDQIHPKAMHHRMAVCLDRLDLDGVAITSYSTPDAQAALRWCRQHRRTAVCMLASKADDARRQRWREWIKRQLVEQFDAGLAGGSPQRRYLEALGLPKDRTFIPYNVVDNAYFARRARAIRASGTPSVPLPGLEDPRPFFLAVCRFIPLKNLDTLVRAYARYRSRHPTEPWRLVLVGDGPERARLEALADTAGAADVCFAGFQQIERLPEYYARAGALVHPSFKETWGLVINEALASGVPVVASERIGAAEDLIAHGSTGYRFDPDRHDVLVDLLEHVASLPAGERAEIVRAGSERIHTWSPERFARGLWQAFEAGRAHSDRGLSLIPRLILDGQRLLAQRADSFHAIPE